MRAVSFSALKHDVQQNVAWLGRFFLLTCPQDEHICKVYAGSALDEQLSRPVDGSRTDPAVIGV